MLFKRKNEPQSKLFVDLGDLQGETENLTAFLELHLKTTVYQVKGKLAVDEAKVSISDLNHAVKKFVYHKRYNITHWVSIAGLTVKINRFKKHEKKGKPKKESLHQTITQSWGL